MCRLFAAISVAALAVLSTQASAQSSDTDAILKRLETKVDALAKENAELRERVRKLEPARQAAKTKSARTEVSPEPALAAPQEIVPPTILNVTAEPVVPEIKHTSGVVLGLEGVLAKPYYSGEGEPNIDALAESLNVPFLTSYQQFPYEFKGGYRAWLGYVDASGWGARVRYFDYHQAALDDVSVIFGAPSGSFTLTGALTLQKYDFELTKQLLYGDWTLTAFGGVSWATAHQRSDLQAFGIATTDLALGYNGVGPTIGMEGEVALAPGSAWSVYYSGRGSLLFGTQTDNTNDTTGLYLEGLRSQSAFASIWELSAGPQWKTPVAGVGDVYARVTADAQYWQGVGDFAPVATMAAPFLGLSLNHNDYSGGFGLLGFTAAVGIER